MTRRSRNLGYMQLKKTHDAALALILRAYGERPRFTYFTGTSQGGREALTVAQRYPADYDGVIANVPIVSLSSLMLAPELIRIQEKPAANWVTRAKVAAIRAEFMRQCDRLDGLIDGVINNYLACRAVFDVTEGPRNRRPWATKRCPNNTDPDPSEHERRGMPDRWPDFDARARLRPLPVRDASRTRAPDIRHVGAEHRSFRERTDCRRAIQKPGGCRSGRARARASRRPGCDRVPHAGFCRRTRSTTRKAAG